MGSEDASARTWPIAFEGHAGWLHAPPEDRAGAVGVVLCAPLGRDARCAHRPLRLFAERLAAQGISTLRYDPLGAGDSLDLPDEVGDAMPIWLEGVRQAIEQLRTLTGVERVVLVGLRFAATLAVLAREHADGLVLLAPITRGRAWIRELTLATAVLAPTTGGAGQVGGLDADGLVLSPATVSAISAIDLRDLDLRDRPALVVAQNPAVQAFGEAASASVEAFTGFDALFDDSHSNRAPEAVFEATTNWIASTFGEALARRIEIARPDPEQACLHPQGAVERPVVFGAGLRGVLCVPAGSAQIGDTAVALGNTGGDPRAGIGGFSTATARALARVGTMSLRFDFAGLGDSPSPDEAVGSHVYETPREPDFEAARALLVERGASRVVVGGVCSGGYHALRAALSNPELSGVFAVNTVVLAWREGTSLAIGDRDQGRSTKAYLQRAGDAQTWARLLGGGLDLHAVSRTVLGRVRKRWEARSSQAPEAVVKARMAAMAARGGRLWWVVGSEDPAMDAVEAHFGLGGRRLSALTGAQLRVVDDLDHGLGLRGSREKAKQELLAFVADLDGR